MDPHEPAARAVVAFQDWREMLFLHWPVPADVLRARIPPTLELDVAEGTGWVTLLPLGIERARPRGLPEALAPGFFEVNLRTYVRHGGEPGIWFFSLDADARPAVWGARALLGLPYQFADITRVRDGGALRYTCRRHDGPSCAVTARTGELRGPVPTGTLDHFLLERYTLFVQRSHALVRQRIRHEPYPVGDVTLDEVEGDLVSTTASLDVAPRPELVHYSPGVDVSFFLPERVRRAKVGADLGKRTPANV